MERLVVCGERPAERPDAVLDLGRGPGEGCVAVDVEAEATVLARGFDDYISAGLPQALGHDEVRSRLDPRGQALRGDLAGDDQTRMLFGQHVERGGKAFLSEDRGKQAVRKLAQLDHGGPHIALRLGELGVKRVIVGCDSMASETEAESQRHQLLLRSVVKVALQAPSLGVGRRDDPGARGAQTREM